MRILFLSNFYPPASRGGYAQWCQEVADGLRDRGHDVVVATSDYKDNELRIDEPTWIHRKLTLEMEMGTFQYHNSLLFFIGRRSREKKNHCYLQHLVRAFSPDIVLVWGMWNLSKSLAALVEKLMPGLVVYYMGDYWPSLPNQFVSYWQAPPRNWATSIAKLLLKRIALSMLSREEEPKLDFEHVLFPTNFMREEFARKGIPSKNTKIIFGAVDTSKYFDRDWELKRVHEPLTLLYIGRLSPEKGIHTAIEAISHLTHRRGVSQLRLMIVGNGEPDYETGLHHLVQQEKVASFVTFIPAQPKERLPLLYNQADIFLFTSIWDEPFGRVIVESMAAGLAVVGAATGGAPEIMEDNRTALLFPPGDSLCLAAQVARLIESPQLRERLGKAGRETALARFDIHRMIVEIEQYLLLVISS